MESIISTFHLDWGLFIAQLVNFAIVFAALYWLVFKPLIGMMTERSRKIEQSLRNADEIEDRLAKTTKEKEKIIAAAKKEANLIVAEAAEIGSQKREELVAQAKQDIGQVINDEKVKLSREKAETLKEIKKEVADLVLITVKKLLDSEMDEAKDRELVNKILKK